MTELNGPVLFIGSMENIRFYFNITSYAFSVHDLMGGNTKNVMI
jgi:hypothetical protein